MKAFFTNHISCCIGINPKPFDPKTSVEEDVTPNAFGSIAQIKVQCPTYDLSCSDHLRFALLKRYWEFITKDEVVVLVTVFWHCASKEMLVFYFLVFK
ncbi:hypothetical protein CTI12_AA066380 [Artemisia annua]|uniref:Uncharacterized protein n=1 Tax=Artemisia annua TaxID=35608 RepID=A0A2U1Q3N1_ARTAN|nr:hypothetical protein CTI12_AA066380 [Artemisia annua]